MSEEESRPSDEPKEDRQTEDTALKQDVARDDKFFRFAAGKGVMNLPNKLTISRMVMIPVFVLFFYLGFEGHYFVALAIFIIASLTDLLDGKLPADTTLSPISENSSTP